MLLPHNGYCKYCCYEHYSACIFLNYNFLWVYMPRSRIAWSYGSSVFSFFPFLFWESGILFSTVAVPIYTPSNSIGGFPFSSTLCSTYSLQIFLMMAILTGVKWCLVVVLTCVSLIIISLVMLSIFTRVCWPSGNIHWFVVVIPSLSCVWLCNPVDCRCEPHHPPEFAQSHVCCVHDADQVPHILSSPSPPDFNLSQQQGLFQWVSPLHQMYWSFSFSISPSNEDSGLISFRIDWFHLLAVQGTLKSLLQQHNSKASILWLSALLWSNSHLCTWSDGKTIALTIWTFWGKVMSLHFNMLSRFIISFHI